MRVVIRKPLHEFITQKAEALGVQDVGEVVNYLLLQIMDRGMGCITVSSPTAPTMPQRDDLSDLAGLLGE